MDLRAGKLVWIPCDVKPGPFSNERIVRLRSDRGDWLAFVLVDALRDPIVEGSTFVRAVIIDVNGSRFYARVAGEPLASSLFEGSLARVEPIAALQA
jgi:hypothetical protein